MTAGRSPEDILLCSTNNAPELLVCSIFEDQRPLKGVAGALDWRLRGFLSRFAMGGRISGAREEFVYIPIRRHDTVRHLMLVGLGPHQESLDSPDSDRELGTRLLNKLAERIESLKLPKVVISRSSFPFLSEAAVKRALEGVEVEFTE